MSYATKMPKSVSTGGRLDIRKVELSSSALACGKSLFSKRYS